MGSRLAAATLVLGLLGVATARAEPNNDPQAMGVHARKHLELGLAHYHAKDYEPAIREFAAGYELDPRPEFLFAMAQAERLSGDCRSAIVLYRRFLAEDPPAQAGQAATENIERCEVALDSSPSLTAEPASPPPDAAAPTRGPPPAGDPRADADAAWYRDPVGASLLAGAAASAAIGLGFWVASSDDEAAARAATSYGTYDDRLASARTKRAVALAGFGAGAALAAGAALHYLLWDPTPDAPRVGVALGEASAGLWIAGAF